jgi:CheY-like chemotaxis protein
VIEAENGEEALAAVARQPPDLILMDIKLPILDGYEATRRRLPAAAGDTIGLQQARTNPHNPRRSAFCRLITDY